MVIFRKLLIVSCVVVFCISCLEKKHSPYTDYNLKNTLRYPIGTEPPTLDWSKSTDTTSSLIIQNIMEGLTEYDFSGDFVKIKGGLARSWKSSSDKIKWVFFLKDSILWTDGKPLKAEHFIDGWERLLNPKTGSEYAYFLFPIKNARAYNQGKIKDFNQVGVKQGKSGELIVHLEKSLSYLPYLLTHPSTYPIRKDIIQKKKSLWTHPKNIITLGPYKLTQWDHDKALILKFNEKYYGSKPSVEKIILYIIPEETTILNLFSSGRLDVAVNLPSRDLIFLKKRKEYKSYNILSLYYYGFNIQAKSLRDVRIRKAIIHAIDRREIVNLLNGGQKPLKSWIPEGLFAHNPNIGLDFDPSKSKKFLKEGGYLKSSQIPKIKIFYNTTSNHKMIAENIQAQLKRNLNIDVELNNQEWKTYLQRLKTKDVEFFRMGWLADYPDPDNFMSLITSFSDNNHTNWKNEKFDHLVLKAMVTSNGPQRKKLYDRAQKILLEEDAVAMPLFSGVAHILVSPRIKYPTNIMSEVLFKKVEFVNQKSKEIQ